MNWSQLLETTLPVVVLVGGGLLRTHSKVKQALVVLEQILAAATSGKSGE